MPFHIHQYLYGGDACNLHRMLLPARYCGDLLAQEGIRVTCNDGIPNGDFDCFTWHGVPPGFDKAISQFVQWQNAGKYVAWSMDDDYRRIPAWNPVQMTGQMTALAAWASRFADHVLASTATLADTLRPRPVHVAPNLIEVPVYEPMPKSGDTIRIVYAGSNTHRGDVDQIVDAISEVLGKYPHVEFIMFGNTHPELKRRHLYSGLTEWPSAPLADYWPIVRKWAPDIWLCPLVDCEFNRSKSSLKVLEGMAFKSAVVASDVTPYRDVIRIGHNGILVDPEDSTGRGWVDALSLLIEDAKYRKELTEAGYETVHSRYNWHQRACIEPWMEYYRTLAASKRSEG